MDLHLLWIDQREINLGGPLHLFDALLYHKYDVQRKIGCANPDDVLNALINQPTPGKNPKPATPGGTYNNADTPFGDNYVTSYITTDLNTGLNLVVNMTGGRSDFPHGYAARSVMNGVLHTYGEGNDPYQAFPGIGDIAAEILWGNEAKKIIPECPCKQ